MTRTPVPHRWWRWPRWWATRLLVCAVVGHRSDGWDSSCFRCRIYPEVRG